MALVISLDVAELAATRFATSPLGETIRALHLLAKPDPPAVASISRSQEDGMIHFVRLLRTASRS